jgi:hypothetical protein
MLGQFVTINIGSSWLEDDKEPLQKRGDFQPAVRTELELLITPILLVSKIAEHAE